MMRARRRPAEGASRASRSHAKQGPNLELSGQSAITLMRSPRRGTALPEGHAPGQVVGS